MWTRLLAALAALPLVCAYPPLASAQDSESESSSYLDDHFDYVPLQFVAGEHATVRQVFLNVGNTVQASDPGQGVVRNDQNRLGWSRLLGETATVHKGSQGLSEAVA